MHCFGHVHRGWGARQVVWRGEMASPKPSHFTDIDNLSSKIVTNLARLHDATFEGETKPRCFRVPYNSNANADPKSANSTLFLNAALEVDGELTQLPFITEIDLPSQAQPAVSGQRVTTAPEKGLLDHSEASSHFPTPKENDMVASVYGRKRSRSASLDSEGQNGAKIVKLQSR
ncbi:hypothetical protein MN608_07502 [Microdochium nivale]|nr:hypothetical protein MN608_07502 [Microdochium nivale]